MMGKRALGWITGLTPCMGALGAAAGMVLVFRGMVRQEAFTSDVLIKGVMIALVTTLILLLFTAVPLAVWAHFRDRDDPH
jgi:biopolymer transport protein ExbB/TolQ